MKEKKKICIRENFVSYGTKNLDSKDRISLGGKVKKILADKLNVDGFNVMIGDEGDILLRPIANISSRDQWLHNNPQAIGKVKEGGKTGGEGTGAKIIDIDSYLKDRRP
jgi:hypothetical protein